MKNKLILFGTGRDSLRIARNIDKSKNMIVAYADNNQEKWGDKYQGKLIIPPDTILTEKYDYIVIVCTYWLEISKQLMKLGVAKEAVKIPYGISIKKFRREFSDIYNLRGKFDYYYRKWLKTEQFNPDFAGMLVNPYYICRKRLWENIRNYSNYLSGKCMDFGCGTKPYRKLFNVTEYVGVEIDTDDKKPGIVYYDGHVLPFADESFDSIFSSQVFEHVLNIEEILEELHRVLKPGGYMMLTVPFIYPQHLWPFDFKRYTTEGIKNLCLKEGFECVRCKRSAGYIETLAQVACVYVNEDIPTSNLLVNAMKKVAVAGINIFGVSLSNILPKSEKFYLDNIIIVKKMR